MSRSAAGGPGRSLLLLCTGTGVGGMERVAIGLARELRARDWRVRAVFPAAPRTGALEAWAEEQGVAVECSDALVHLGRERTAADVHRLRAFVREAGCEVVNLHYGANHIPVKDVLAVRLAGARRCVASVHHPHAWSTAARRARLTTAVAGRLAHRVVVNSSATRAVCREAGVPESRLRVIPPGVRPPARCYSREEARAALGVEGCATVVGALGRLVPEKGIDRLIRAMACVDGHTAPLLLVAGDGPERARLEALAAALMPGRCRFLGRVEDADRFYAALDVFALASDLEGFGLVYLEAAQHGVPSVGTDSGGTPDAIEHGRTGLLVPPGDERALAGALRVLLDDGACRRRMGEAARDRAALFTEAAMAESYERVFLE